MSGQDGGDSRRWWTLCRRLWSPRATVLIWCSAGTDGGEVVPDAVDRPRKFGAIYLVFDLLEDVQHLQPSSPVPSSEMAKTSTRASGSIK